MFPCVKPLQSSEPPAVGGAPFVGSFGFVYSDAEMRACSLGCIFKRLCVWNKGLVKYSTEVSRAVEPPVWYYDV